MSAVLSLDGDTVLVEDDAVEYVIGVDEAGRGCMAGPVGVAAVCFRLPRASDSGAACPPGIQDSKVMKPADRTAAFEALVRAINGGATPTRDAVVASALHTPEKRVCIVASGVGGAHTSPVLGLSAVLVDSAVIDRVNILNATLEGMSLVCAELVQRLRGAGVGITARNTVVLIDGNRTPWHFLPPAKQRILQDKASKTGNISAIGTWHPALDGLRCRTVVGGDGTLYCVAAASVVAKVLRDAFAVEVMHRHCPAYGFGEHKGYVTPLHKAMLAKHGPCAYHRRSFAPVAELCGLPCRTKATPRKRTPSQPPAATRAGGRRREK